MQPWKKNKAIIITLPEPCAEDWEEMKPVGCGRFCNQCQKTVIDFTLLPDEQLGRLLAAGRPLCGRFLPEQLNRPIPIPEQPKHNRLYGKLAAAAVFLAPYFSVLPATAQKSVKTVMIDKDTAKATKPIRINGTITDAQTEKPLIRMEISIDGLDKQYSDRNGYFSFTLPDTYTGKQITVKAAYFPLSSAEQNNSIILEETITIDASRRRYKVALLRYPMGIIENDKEAAVAVEQRRNTTFGGAPVSYAVHTPRPSIWKRITRIFKHKRNY